MRATAGGGKWGALVLWAMAGCARAPTLAPASAAPSGQRAMCPVATVEDLKTRVANAIIHESPSLVQSLVLPIGWPPRAQGVEILTYRVEALPTGAVAYDMHSAHVITISPWIAEPHVEHVFPVKLGREFEGAALPLETDAQAAEQALIDVIARCRPAEGARAALTPYLEWVDSHPVRGRDLVAHAPEFFAWLRQGASQAKK